MSPSCKESGHGWSRNDTVNPVLLAVIMMATVAPRSEAAEWSLAPSLGVKGAYNSNLLLTPSPHHDTYGYWVTPATELAGKTERLEVNSRIAADVVGYFGGEERQFTNVYAPLSVRYQTEKDLVGFTGGFTRDNTLLSELQETGVVLQFAQRNQWTLNPTWTRKLTEKLSFQSGAQLSDTTYETDRLVDYRLVGGSGGFRYQLTERDEIHVTGSYVDFHTTSAPASFRANYPGINMRVTRAFTESLTGTIHGGPRFLASRSQTALDAITAHDTVWLAGASMTKNWERGTLRVSFDRDLAPSGFGLLIQTNRGEIAGSYELSETVTGSLNVAGILTSGKSSAAVGGVFPDNSYVSLTPKLSWKFLEWWQAEVSYMYRWRDVDTAENSAESHATTFMVTYYPPKLSFSH
ncbi:porin family protein [Candidatus Nitrospira nitrificans]|uniref:Uncharacterized protein n=1 Tax=Candidatus Nitrospira nitrificans TaxID=1742973 RepID=A0A0S4L8E2_9BACT|nr:hypothetical protein [Candidatus Nitrospira nitrificans]CUS31394.1 conserved hypothetical protein [Candidatus Nitrospira nitrificans]